MLEKLLLAAFLTFAVSLSTKISWSSSSQTTGEVNLYNHAIFTLTQRDN
ncbi:hypothetical protein OGM63_00635 [Plectonema radiosum NIES-515]|jgi:hypothetical protein|uniref:Uncharacterized protein n=1 Tax=Plectonema radiosum NIES-515 TaxID=2986073 RepID=A0ABT3ASE8_9CYAN|nr:hypothetical protein [Plectonema radiosum]MCV3212043.1 hypothetical protein [Plectonema radiosum NIES-515]